LGTLIWETLDGIRVPGLSNILIDFMHLNKLKQFNFIHNNMDRILDLVMSTAASCNVSQNVSPLINIDPFHPSLDVVITFASAPRLSYNNVNTRPNFYKAKYDLIRADLSNCLWDDIFYGLTDVNDMLNAFSEVVKQLVRRHVPLAKPKNNRIPPWFDKNLKRALNEKNKIRVRYKKYKNPMDALELKLLSKRCERLATSRYNAYISKVEDELTANP
jgi:hypothetical protein